MHHCLVVLSIEEVLPLSTPRLIKRMVIIPTHILTNKINWKSDNAVIFFMISLFRRAYLFVFIL